MVACFPYHNFLVVTQLQLVQFLLKQAGVEKRTGDLFGNRDLLNIARNMARGLKVCIWDYTCPGTFYFSQYVMWLTFCKIQGVENVYTQHQPLLFQTMESITRGRLRDVDYPFVGDHFQQGRYVPLVFQILKSYNNSRWQLRISVMRKLTWTNQIAHNFWLWRPQEVVIFMVGGTTYEESRSVALQNATNSGIRFILGGTAVLNSKRYVQVI